MEVNLSDELQRHLNRVLPSNISVVACQLPSAEGRCEWCWPWRPLWRFRMLDVSFLDEDTDVIKSIQFVSLIQSFKTDKTALCAWKS